MRFFETGMRKKEFCEYEDGRGVQGKRGEENKSKRAIETEAPTGSSSPGIMDMSVATSDLV